MVEGITYPVVVDADHVVTELYAISNVPTVVLINEDDTIAMPNWSAYGSDLFSEFTGVESGKQHDRIRRWVREGDAGMSTAEAIGEPKGEVAFGGVAVVGVPWAHGPGCWAPIPSRL